MFVFCSLPTPFTVLKSIVYQCLCVKRPYKNFLLTPNLNETYLVLHFEPRAESGPSITNTF